jgi:hypothetical protein
MDNYSSFRAKPGLAPVTGLVIASLAVIALAGMATAHAIGSRDIGADVVLLLIVAACMIGELMARVRTSRRSQSGSGGESGEIISRRAAGIGVAFIAVVGTLMGLFSLVAILALDGCESSRCSTVVGSQWVVMLATEALAFIYGIVRGATARFAGQLGRAVTLGLAAPFIAIFMFNAAATTATLISQHAVGLARPSATTFVRPV